MHCPNCSGFITPNVSTCTCDELPTIKQRLDMHFRMIARLYEFIDIQRATIASMSGRLDLLGDTEDQQDTALTELESRMLDIEAFYGLKS